MAHTLSAKKRIRQNVERRALNRWRKGRIRDAIRGFNEALRTHDTDSAGNQLKEVFKQLDQVAAKGTIHKNTAARKKSRLAKRLAAEKAKAH